MRKLKPFGRADEGVIAVEFALILPLMLVALFGSFSVTRMARASSKVWNVAQTVGSLVAQQSTVTNAQISDFCTGGTLILAPFTGAVAMTVASVTYNATSGARAVDWQDTTCGGAVMSDALAQGTLYTPNPSDSVIVVKLTYTYTFSSSYLLPKSFSFTRYSYSRPRNGTQVLHS